MFRKACLVVAFGLFVFAGSNYGQSATISSARQTTEDRSIRPFKTSVPQTTLEDLRRRIAATRWPDKETDPSQGVPLARLQGLVRYWPAATTGAERKPG